MMTSPIALKRILMTADPLGGVWTYALELARALEPHGIELALATMGGPLTSAQRMEVARLRHASVFEGLFKLEWMEHPWHDVEEAGKWLLQIESQFKPDLIHLNGYVHGSLPWSSPTLVVGHSCVLSWWRAVRGENAPDSRATYRKKVMLGLHSSQTVVAPSRAMLADLERHYGPLTHGHVIYNARDPTSFMSALKEEFVICAGRLWDQAKNVEALAKIANRLAWPVYFAGEDRHPAGNSPRLENVRLLGRLSQKSVASWLSRAAIYAAPARYEPFGLSILEAALSGCALVLGDIGSLREIWEGAAIFVHPNDEEGLRFKLSELIRDAARRRELAIRARTRALKLNPRQMANCYMDTYRNLLAASQQGGAEKEAAACG